MEFLVILALMALVVILVTAPLRKVRRPADPVSDDLRDLEAAREAKLREIRDAELDRGTGKLSDADFLRIDGELRAEAVEILRRLDATRQMTGGEGAGGEDQPAER